MAYFLSSMFPPRIGRTLSFVLIIFFFFSSTSRALFDTGTALEKGEFEIDVAVNPFRSIEYGQNFAFLHYGLGNGYEVHGYLSKWGTICDWDNSTYETYMGILKQWANFEYVDLATVIGIRKVLNPANNPSLIGPGVLYTLKTNPSFRIAGHLQFIGNIYQQHGRYEVTPLNLGYTSEIGLYFMLTKHLEFAFGCFTNSAGIPRPIYTFNYYF